MSLERLYRDPLVQIAKNLNYSDILNLCKTNSRFARDICNNVDFWVIKLQEKPYIQEEDIQRMKHDEDNPYLVGLYQDIVKQRVLRVAPRLPGGIPESNALHYAISLDDTEFIDILIDSESGDPKYLDLALAYSYWDNHPSVTTYLLDKYLTPKIEEDDAVPFGYWSDSHVTDSVADALAYSYPGSLQSLEQLTDVYLQRIAIPLQENILHIINPDPIVRENTPIAQNEQTEMVKYVLDRLRSLNIDNVPSQEFLNYALKKAETYDHQDIANLLRKEGAQD